MGVIIKDLIWNPHQASLYSFWRVTLPVLATCLLLSGEELQGKLPLNKQLENHPRSSCTTEIKTLMDNQEMPGEAHGIYIFIVQFAFPVAGFSSTEN